MRIFPPSFQAMLLLALGLPACGSSTNEAASSPSPDAGPNTNLDAATDGAPDVAVDGPANDVSQPDAMDEGEAPDGSACPPPSDNTQWTVETVDDGPGFKARVAIALDLQQQPRLAYNVATSPDGWGDFELRIAERSGSGFEHLTVVESGGFSTEFPTIAIDGNGISHVVYNRYVPEEDQIDVFLVSGTIEKGFTAPVNLTNTADSDETGPVVAVGPDEALHVIYMQRTKIPDNAGKYTYATGYASFDGSVASTELIASDTLPFTGQPEQHIAVDGAGIVHVVYLRPGIDPSRGVAHYRSKGTAGWTAETRVTSDDQNVSGVSLAPAGDKVHFAYGKGTLDVTMTHRTLDGSGLSPEASLTTSKDDRAYYLGLGAFGMDRVYLAYRRMIGGNADVFFIRGEQGVFGAEELITQTGSEDEQLSSLAVGSCGEAFVAFAENLSTAPDGRVMVGMR